MAECPTEFVEAIAQEMQRLLRTTLVMVLVTVMC